LSASQVLRHTALVTGLFYGLFHARTVQTEYEHRVLAERENHKDDLMHKAKEAFKAAKAKKDSPLTKGACPSVSGRLPLPPSPLSARVGESRRIWLGCP
jgi:hypothetical protein